MLTTMEKIVRLRGLEATLQSLMEEFEGTVDALDLEIALKKLRECRHHCEYHLKNEYGTVPTFT